MRKFSSYGPVDTDEHYYVPREALIEQAYTQLIGENPDKGGHYITVWAPRQRGKSWVMQQALQRLESDSRFETVILNLEDLKLQSDVDKIMQTIASEIIRKLELEELRISQPLGAKGGLLGTALNLFSYLPFKVRPQLSSFFASASLDEFHRLFQKGILKKPLILILDEFDALGEEAISALVSVFRKIYLSRQYQMDKVSAEKEYLLHSVALIGVRSVLGIENKRGSPFNVQRSLHIPNLTKAEVYQMYQWYQRESGQQVEEAVMERVYDETQGQPGLVSWLGELLTETYNKHQPSITSRDFEIAYSRAIATLPNSNILNIISKAKQEAVQPLVLKIFQTDKKLEFWLDDPRINFLYMNGVVDQEVVNETELYLKFPSPFVQKRLFHYFARLLFEELGQLHEPFEDLSDTITDKYLNVKNLLKHYSVYLHQNRESLFKDAPRRATDLRIFEAVYHFNLYMYLSSFLQPRGGQVYPEFPTGNGQIDLIINYAGGKYGLELKSYTDETGYKKAIKQAARYGKQLNLSQISLVFFIESIDDGNREKYERTTVDEETKVSVETVFVTTNS